MIDRKALGYSATAFALALGSLLNAHARAPAAPPAGVVVRWASFYIGAHVGSADDSGGVFGMHGGWNFQRGSLMAGVEADLSSIDIEKSALEPEDGTQEAIGSADSLGDGVGKRRCRRPSRTAAQNCRCCLRQRRPHFD